MHCHRNSQRYIELNPIRARMVAAAKDYPWSSHAANAGGMDDPLVRPHPLYLALGPSAEARQKAYRPLFEQCLDDDFVAEVRAATQGGWAIGGERFKEEIAARLHRRVTPLPPGRPVKRRANREQLDLLWETDSEP